MARLHETARQDHDITNGNQPRTVSPAPWDARWSLTVPREATGAAALERALLRVTLQKLRSSPLGLLDVDENARKTSDPAVLVVGGGRTPRLSVAHQTQHRQQTPCGSHCAQLKSEHFKSPWRTGISGERMAGAWQGEAEPGGLVLLVPVTLLTLQSELRTWRRWRPDRA